MTAVLQVPNTFIPPSQRSSRAPSPAPHEKTVALIVEPGTQPDYVYDNVLPAWRAAIRRYLVRGLKWESEAIGAMQVRPPLASQPTNTDANAERRGSSADPG